MKSYRKEHFFHPSLCVTQVKHIIGSVLARTPGNGSHPGHKRPLQGGSMLDPKLAFIITFLSLEKETPKTQKLSKCGKSFCVCVGREWWW